MTTETGQTAEARCAYMRGSLAPDVLDRIPESELREELQRARTAYYCPERRAALYESVQRRTRPRVERAEAAHEERVRTFSDGQRGVLLGWHR